MRLSELAVVPLLLCVCGCETVAELVQPANVPVFVDSYRKENLSARTGDVPCILNLVNCAEKATLVVKNFSGSTTPGPTFPLRAIVKEECLPMIQANFGQVVPAEEAKIEIKLEARKAILLRDGDDLTFTLSFAVMILHPHHQDKPFFSKIYEVETIGTMMNEVQVPDCVYEAVQRILLSFVNEIAGDAYLVARLDELTK